MKRRFKVFTFDHRPIQQEIKKLESLVNKPDSSPPLDRIQVAMGRFLTTSTLESFQDIRLVSYGAATPLGVYQIRLIEKKDHFLKLINVINRYQDRPRAFRRLYRGLLTSYFNYDPEAQYAKDYGPKNTASACAAISTTTSTTYRQKDLIPTGLPFFTNTAICSPMILAAVTLKRYWTAQATSSRKLEKISVFRELRGWLAPWSMPVSGPLFIALMMNSKRIYPNCSNYSVTAATPQSM